MLKCNYSNIYLAVALALLTACGTPAQIVNKAPTRVAPISAGQEARPIQFRKIVTDIARGSHVGALEVGLLCVPNGNLQWRSGNLTISDNDFTEIFIEELKRANFETIGDPNALFPDPDDWRAEYLVAGTVTSLKANICWPMLGFGDSVSSKGQASMSVEWQIYSRLDRSVVAKVKSSGVGTVTTSTSSGSFDVFLFAFADATRGLLADKQFREVVLTSPAEEQALAESTFGSPISLGHSAKGNGEDWKLSKAVQSVVTVYAGDGHGSGFLVSEEGHILTNSHVVENAENVRVKWADGTETLAVVLRSDRRRDVAVLKSYTEDQAPLRLREARPPVGEAVYAVGSPLLSELSGSVTGGIVSGYREERGYDFIQSDAVINPGNSGGPLLDSNGRVVGIAVSGLFRGDAGTGINFFIPIGDALNSLNAYFLN